MLEDFTIPKHGVHRGGLREADTNVTCTADILDDLTENSATYITEDDNYERCEELVRTFLRLDARQRSAVVDVFAANLSTISTSARGLLSDQESASPVAAMRHRNGIKMLVFLLHSIAMQAAKEPQPAKGAENAAKAKTTGRGRKAAAIDADTESSWDWDQGKQHVLAAIRDLITLVDLKALFKGLSAAQQLINLCMELALQGLEAPNIAKQETNWPACRDVLVLGAVQYQQSEFVAHALMELVRKHEHMPQLAALIAKYAEEQHNNTQLAVLLLSEYSAQSPEDYDTQYGTNQISVRLAGDLVIALAELMPKVVSNQMSQLQPYLGCGKAYCLRGALLQAVGSMLVQVYRSDSINSSLGAGAVQAHLRSKEALLTLLHARMLDKVSFVRQKVLQTWGKLVEESCVPLSHWNTLLQAAIGRLEDDSQLVVKAALQLLHKMVAQGIFQPPLKTNIYINNLHQAEAELAKLQPAGPANEDDDDGVEGADGADGAGGGQEGVADGARWEDGGIQIKQEPMDQPMTEQNQPAGSPNAGVKPSNEGGLQRLRAMVASLKEGASFCKRLAATLPQLQVLLANPAANVVHDSIVFLTLCKTFEVTGAAKALRAMWPLVFSKHEPVRGAVLDSWHILHLHEKLPKQQMEELVVNVIPDCSLSELTALEAIIASLVQQDKLSAVALMKQTLLHAVSSTEQLRKLPVAVVGSTDSSTAAARQEDEPDKNSTAASIAEQQAALRNTIRHASTLLSMLTAAQPSALAASYVPVLLEVGFAADLMDTWVARQTCLVLKHAASHLTGTGTAAQSTAHAASTPSSPVLSPEVHQSALAAIVRLLVATPSAVVASNWPSAAEAAIAALYALSAQPQELMAAVLDEMFRRCTPGNQPDDSTICGYSAAALSRFFFALGQGSVQHLLCIEQTSRAIRAARLAADRAAAESVERQMAAEAAGAGSSGSRRGKAAAVRPAAEDIGAQLGVGSVAADAELDALAETIEAQVLAKDQLLGKYGQLLSRFLHLKSTLSAPQHLQECALLALTQLMAVDGAFCADNLRLMFTLLLQRHVSAPMRVNMVVALADLASRFPNLLEPWTAEIYLTLADPEPAVKLSALTSLTHLVLGGMVKAKGRNVAQVAVLLVDDVQEINDRAVLFFDPLAKTGSGNARSAASAAAGASSANPVYNLLPDCLSTLMTMKELREEQLQVIMGHLLAFVKDKQAESLRERLVARLQAGGPHEWRLVSWCIGQLGYSEKGLRRIMELTACYRHALAGV